MIIKIAKSISLALLLLLCAANVYADVYGSISGTVRDNSGNPDQSVDLRGFGVTGDQNTLVLVDGQRLSENA